MDTDHHDITLSVNGRTYQRRVESRMLLSDFIRHELGLAGEHHVADLVTLEYEDFHARCWQAAALARTIEAGRPKECVRSRWRKARR